MLLKEYGEDFCKERVVGCQGHFRSDANKKSKTLPEDMPEIFNKICEKLCKSTTTASQYNLLKAQLEEMAKKQPTLQSWIKWWDARCSHILPLLGGRTPWCKSKRNRKCRLETIQHIKIGTCCQAGCSFYDATGK